MARFRRAIVFLYSSLLPFSAPMISSSNREDIASSSGSDNARLRIFLRLSQYSAVYRIFGSEADVSSGNSSRIDKIFSAVRLTNIPLNITARIIVIRIAAAIVQAYLFFIRNPSSVARENLYVARFVGKHQADIGDFKTFRSSRLLHPSSVFVKFLD